MIATDRLADVFVDVADTLVADFDLVEFLQTLTDHAAAVSGADAVGLVLADHRGALQFMAASNESGRALELFQLQAERIRRLEVLAGGAARVPWYIMTSGPTRAPTQRFFEERAYFGLRAEDVVFFEQGELAAAPRGGAAVGECTGN